MVVAQPNVLITIEAAIFPIIAAVAGLSPAVKASAYDAITVSPAPVTSKTFVLLNAGIK